MGANTFHGPFAYARTPSLFLLAEGNAVWRITRPTVLVLVF
jgi:hypothetical protein